MTPVLVDSNIWIFSVISEYPEHPSAVAKLKSFSHQGILINCIIVSETYHMLRSFIGWQKALLNTRKILDSEFTDFVSLSVDTVRKAMSLSAEKKLLINDALIAQHALDMKAALLTDNIRDFEKVPNLHLLKLK